MNYEIYANGELINTIYGNESFVKSYCEKNGYTYRKREEPEPDNTANRIAELKANLTATDYQAIKYAEGWLTDEEYEPIRAQRQAWRDEINELEG